MSAEESVAADLIQASSLLAGVVDFHAKTLGVDGRCTLILAARLIDNVLVDVAHAHDLDVEVA